jgi:hypothetical protein
MAFLMVSRPMKPTRYFVCFASKAIRSTWEIPVSQIMTAGPLPKMISPGYTAA